MKGERDNTIELQCDKSIKQIPANMNDDGSWFEGNGMLDYGLKEMNEMDYGLKEINVNMIKSRGDVTLSHDVMMELECHEFNSRTER